MGVESSRADRMRLLRGEDKRYIVTLDGRTADRNVDRSLDRNFSILR